jgi:hypothetical protein
MCCCYALSLYALVLLKVQLSNALHRTHAGTLLLHLCVGLCFALMGRASCIGSACCLVSMLPCVPVLHWLVRPALCMAVTAIHKHSTVCCASDVCQCMCTSHAHGVVYPSSMPHGQQKRRCKGTAACRTEPRLGTKCSKGGTRRAVRAGLLQNPRHKCT